MKVFPFMDRFEDPTQNGDDLDSADSSASTDSANKKPRIENVIENEHGYGNDDENEKAESSSGVTADNFGDQLRFSGVRPGGQSVSSEDFISRTYSSKVSNLTTPDGGYDTASDPRFMTGVPRGVFLDSNQDYEEKNRDLGYDDGDQDDSILGEGEEEEEEDDDPYGNEEEVDDAYESSELRRDTKPKKR